MTRRPAAFQLAHPPTPRRAIGIPLSSLVLAALVLTGCGAVPSTKIAASKPKSVVSKAPTKTAVRPAPSPSGSPAPSAAPTAKPTPIPTPTAGPIEAGKTVVVAGMVHAADGAALTGAVVRARSLSAEAPYEAEVVTDTGSYVLNDVPSGALIEVVASRPGWTARRRVGAFDAANRDDRKALDFGGADSQAYALSPYPEVTATTPVSGAAEAESRRVSIRLQLSEPLDAENRARFARALRLLPAVDAANGGAVGTTTDLTATEDTGYPRAVTVDGAATVAPYSLAAGNAFMADPAKVAAVTWEPAGDAAQFTFDAPLLTSNAEAVAYQLALVSGGADQRVHDRDGLQLGTDAAGGTAAYPPAGDLVPGVFRAVQPVAQAVPGLAGAAAVWASTHDDVLRFELARDEDAPTLLGVRTVYMGNDTRLELTFDEPMGAYNGTLGAFVSAGFGDDATDLANYTFALGRTAADLADVTLDGVPDPNAADVDPQAVLTWGASDMHAREFRFAATCFAPSRAAALPGQVAVELDDRDARKVWLVIAERPRFFHASASAIATRVVNVADPAGNVVRAKAADHNLTIGAL